MVNYLNTIRFEKYTFVIVNRENDEIVYAGQLSDDVDKYFNSKKHKIRIYKDGKEIKGKMKKKLFNELRDLFALNMYIKKEIHRTIFYDRAIFLSDIDSNMLRELEKEIKKNKELIKDLNRLMKLVSIEGFVECFLDNRKSSIDGTHSVELNVESMVNTKYFIGKVISKLVYTNRELSSILRRYYYRQIEE